MAFPNVKNAIRRFLGHDPQQDAAVELYTKIVAQSRAQAFYEDYGVPDSVEGRFDLLTLHMFFVLRRLKAEGGAQKPFAQRLFDIMFRNMDDSLREMGVGDLKVGKKVRGLAEAFYGRVGAYDAALDSDDPAALSRALSRNVYEMEDAPFAPRLGAYARAAVTALKAQELAALLSGRAEYPDPRAIPMPNAPSQEVRS